MEPDPPDPHFPAVLLAAAARLGWRATARDPSGVELGVLTDSTSDRAMIVISEGSLGTCNGTSTTTGEVLYQGRAYRIRSYFDGCQQARTTAT